MLNHLFDLNSEQRGMMPWSRWQTLTKEAQDYELWRVLFEMDQRTKDLKGIVRLYSMVGGFIGGGATILIIAAAYKGVFF